MGGEAARGGGEEVSSSLLRGRIRGLAKVELHAHLSGSIRESTLRELAASRSAEDGAEAADLLRRQDRSLDTCFRLFALIHRVVRDLDAVRRLAQEVVDDFAAENCRYLEIRTTPRAFNGAEAVAYVRALVDELDARERSADDDDNDDDGLIARLIISVDRTKPVQDAQRLLDSVAALRQRDATVRKFVVGVDFSGNPVTGASFEAFAEVFRRALHVHDLPATIHLAETPRSDGDSEAILAFALEAGPTRCRLGHALCLDQDQLRRSRDFCVEVCPSSNAATLGLKDLLDHPHLASANGHPLAICTDDAAVFASHLSDEYLKVAHALAITDATRLDAFTDDAATYAFDPAAARTALDRHRHRAKIHCAKANQKNSNGAPSSS